ncbi:MAG: DNA alkylation repair protein [Verrucomicrobia bacterium]|nr:DNA alkylation repair protein [Verrucomicrobiota bacterium]
MGDGAHAELRHLFSPARFRALGRIFAECQPGFDEARFVRLATRQLDDLSLLQRMRAGTHALRETLAGDFPTAIPVLRQAAPLIGHSFVGMLLPDFVGVYGRGQFDAAMDTLEYLTRFSSGEFAAREFIRDDPSRALAIMERWSRSPDDQVRRLASEGSRPRLPWSFRLELIVAEPNLTAPILENLKADPSLYVRKSVANHLNDISKDHPDWMLARLRAWDLAHPATGWIAKRAARTLIKAGHRKALALFSFGQRPKAKVQGFAVRPAQLRLGQTVELAFDLVSSAHRPQSLAIDYRVHYVKASGGTSAKVFKLRELTLGPGARVAVRKRQVIRDFTTRRHYPGRHRVEIQVNGEILAAGHFDLRR